MPKTHATFQLDAREVTWLWQGGRSGQRRKLTRASAAVDESSWTLILKHLPTGIEASGSIPAGHYSNKQMQALKEKLWTDLHEALRRSVAGHLRLPGRSGG